MFDNIGLLILTVVMIANLAIDTWKNPDKTHLGFFVLNPLLLPLNVLMLAGFYGWWKLMGLIDVPEFQALINWSWVQAVTGTSSGGLYTAGLRLPVLGVVFGILLVLSLPRLAWFEETLFREGTDCWGCAIKRSIAFGLIHFFVGIPLIGCAAIGISGLVYTVIYWQYGLEQAARLHFQHNLIVVGILATVLLLP